MDTYKILSLIDQSLDHQKIKLEASLFNCMNGSGLKIYTPNSSELELNASNDQFSEESIKTFSNEKENLISSNNICKSVSNPITLNEDENLGIIDLITCKFVIPFHVLNDPRLLECGSSACLRCIQECRDTECNLKCPNCKIIHNTPVDSNKLIVNNNLQSFINSYLKVKNDKFQNKLQNSFITWESKSI